MLKRLIASAVFFAFISCFIYSYAVAELAKEELKAKLNELRIKKTDMLNTYQENLHNINKEADDKIAVLKTDFRKAREKCLEEKRDKTIALHKEHDAALRPMLKEEEELIQAVGLDSAMDFAKPKAKR